MVDRRRAPRHPFLASAEITDVKSGTQLSARTTDISFTGCYFDTMNPFPAGTEVALRITYGDATLEAQGSVANCQPHLGMGVSFGRLDLAQKDILKKWITGCGEN